MLLKKLILVRQSKIVTGNREGRTGGGREREGGREEEGGACTDNGVYPLPSPPLSHRRKVQELESKFKDAYAQSLSAKDERIQVLEERVEETIRDNTQLRQELAALKKQNDTRKDRKNSTHGSPGMTRVYSPHEAAADTAKLKEKVEVLHQSVRDEDVRMSSIVRG